MAIPMQPYKGIKEIPYPSHDMVQRWSSRDRAGEIRLVNETGQWKFDPPLNINDLEGDFETEELVKYSDLNTDNFAVGTDNEVSLNIDYITLSDFSGADYIQPDPKPAAALVLSSTSVNVTEGSSVSVSIHLTREPTQDVVLTLASLNTNVATVTQSSLTFNSSNFSTPQTIDINGIVDANASLDSTSIRIQISSTDVNYSNMTSRFIAVDVADLNNADFVISKSSMTINEGTSDTFSVRLSTEPRADVEIRITSADINIATVDISSIIFTDDNWQTPVTVTVTTLEDTEITDLITSLTVQVYQSLDPDYNSLANKIINITSVNNDNLEPGEIRIEGTIWKTTFETWDDGPYAERGLLYNGHVISEADAHGGLLPGLRIPSNDVDFYDFRGIASSGAPSPSGDEYLGSKLIDPELWESGNLTNNQYVGDIPFKLLPSSYISGVSGSHTLNSITKETRLWTSTPHDEYLRIRIVSTDYTNLRWSLVRKSDGNSIRMLRDATVEEMSEYSDGDIVETVQDYDGNKYTLVKLGTQIWTDKNLATTAFLDGTPITKVETSEDWLIESSTPSCAACDFLDETTFADRGIYYPNGDITNVSEYGLLYTLNALERFIPNIQEGYRLPRYSDAPSAANNTLLVSPLSGYSRISDTSFGNPRIYTGFGSNNIFWEERKFEEVAESKPYKYYVFRGDSIRTVAIPISYDYDFVNPAYSVKLVKDI